MKRPSMYQRHEQSLNNFAKLFNGVYDNLPIILQIYQTENFRDDGIIVNSQTGKRITFDWEIRDKYFINGKFKFDSLGQFERKLKKDEIGLSIQCDSTETAVMVAWHNDWFNSEPKPVRLATDSQKKEKAEIRYTNHFKIYPYKNIKAIRKMIHKALATECFDHSIF